MTLTPRQLEILRFIAAYFEKNLYAPTINEMAQAHGCSDITIFEHLESLERKGMITRRRHEARSIELTAVGLASLSVSQKMLNTPIDIYYSGMHDPATLIVNEGIMKRFEIALKSDQPKTLRTFLSCINQTKGE